ncbi:MAG: EAL domain-containing protein, partial [Pseudomonadota bacterium]
MYRIPLKALIGARNFQSRRIAVLLLWILGSTTFLSGAAWAQISDDMRVSNEAQIKRLEEPLRELPEEKYTERALAKLTLVYVLEESNQQELARQKAKELEYVLSSPVDEKTTAYALYRLLNAYAQEGDYQSVFSLLDEYRSGAQPENASLRRYATSRALGEIYSNLGYHERSVAVISEAMETPEFQQVLIAQMDVAANNLLLANQFLAMERPGEAFEASVAAISHLEDWRRAGKIKVKYSYTVLLLDMEMARLASLIKLNRLEEARQSLEQIQATASDLGRHTILLQALTLRAGLLVEEGRYADAIPLLDKVLSDPAFDRKDGAALDVFKDRAIARERTGNLAGAIADQKTVLALADILEKERTTARVSFLAAEIESSQRREALEELRVKSAIADASAKRSGTIATISTLAAVLTLLASIVAIRAWRVQRSAKAQLQVYADENFEMANLDSLTGLGNRRRFSLDIDRLLDQGAAECPEFCVAMLDLDGFKLVNDAYGHPAGDALLAQTSERLKGCLEPGDTLARLGGDEFGLLCARTVSRAEIEALGQTICDSMSAPFDLGAISVQVTASVGFAAFPKAGKTRSELFERADFALYHAKENGKGHAVLFSAEHEFNIRQKANMELRLREAKLEDEFSVEFQPIMGSNSHQVFGFEALARWKSPSLGQIEPGSFIPLAEKSGLIRSLSPVLLEKALRLASEWSTSVFLSFNLSPQEVTSREYAQQLLTIIDRSGFAPERLIFEITETALDREVGQVTEVLNLFRRAGVRVALDDFGHGSSSFSRLAQMPLDVLKIDRSFLDESGFAHRQASAVLQSIADLSKNLNIFTIIEGVETQSQLDVVQAAGIDLAQGYYFSRPMPAERAGRPDCSTGNAQPV